MVLVDRQYKESRLLNLSQLVLIFLVRHGVTFMVIVLILVAGTFAQKELARYTSGSDAIKALKHGKAGLGPYKLAKEKEVTERIESLEKASLEVLRDRIKTIENEIRQKSANRQPPDATRCVISGGDTCDRYFQELKVDAEIKLLEQERDYLRSVYVTASNKNALAFGQAELERLRKNHAAAYLALQEKETEKARVQGSMGPLDFLNPWSQKKQELDVIRHAISELLASNNRAYDAWVRQKRILDTFKFPKELQKFELRRDQLDSELQKLTTKVAELEERHRENWVTQFEDLTIKVLPASIVILISIILSPVAIKAFMYFVIAPLASRGGAILILPGASGLIEGESGGADSGSDRPRVSAVSLSITIDNSQELLIHPEYLQSSAFRGEKDTKWVLDWSYPLSSFAAGLFGLTRIRTPASDSFVVSSTTDPFSEVSVISLPEASAIVFQPHSLIGVVQARNRPVSISRHWRLGTLNAWLTLQLRYLVFHGPVKLIVKGCRGVRVEKAGTGRSINQAATIGFSANLEYSMTRCETFGSYLMGKQELFNDNFGSGPGFYVYEEMPHFGKKTGITGRGVEGVLDSFLKVLGI